jgi:hypothetical protein
MASTYLSRTFGTATNRKKFTVSFWFKRTDLTSTQILFCGTNSGDEFIYLNGSDGINAECASGQLISNMKLRDTSGWYHVVYTFDSAQATAGDRSALYINGTEVSYSTETQPSQNADPSYINNANLHTIGKRGSANNAYFGGLMSHFHFCDGQAYTPSDFGETDSATGEWKIKTSPSVTYGDNGFFILKDSNSVTDQSGESNNFTVGGGTLTNTEDCPSNVFCILNRLGHASASFTLIEGNTYSGGADNNWRSIFGTIGAKTGKYYYEMKCISSSDYERFGWCTVDQMAKCSDSAGRYDDTGYGSEGYGYTSDGEKSNNGGTSAGYGATWGANDILSCAIDLDNNKIYFGKNGTWQDSGDPTSGSTGTGAAYTIASDKIYVPAFTSYGAAANLGFNFGNGYFRTTAISSEGTNASGIGKFEYDVPAGYTALSTKGLNE